MINEELKEILAGREGKIVLIHGDHDRIIDQWQKERAKFLYNGTVTNQNLREIFPEELVIEFDHLEKAEGYNLEVARNEAITWLNKIEEEFNKANIKYYITDHIGKCPHLHTLLIGIERYPHEIRAIYKKRILDNLLNHIGFKSTLVTPDYTLITSESKLISLETQPHFKTKWRGRPETIIRRNYGEYKQVKPEEIDRLKLELAKREEQEKDISNETTSAEDINLDILKAIWRNYYHEPNRNKLVMAFGGMCIKRGVPFKTAKDILRKLIEASGQRDSIRDRWQQLEYSYEPNKKTVAVYYWLSLFLTDNELFEIYGKFKEAFKYRPTAKDPPTERQLVTLQDPELLNNLVKEIQKIVVGEANPMKSIILTIVGGIFCNNVHPTSCNLILTDESGSGKDFIVSNVLKIFPTEWIYKRSRIGQTTLTYWKSLKDDPNFTWDGKVLYLEDISSSILNCDVMKLFLSKEKGKIEVSTITSPVTLKTMDIPIRGKPIVIATTFKSNFADETIRRITSVTLDTSKAQTIDIIKRIADESNGEKTMKPDIDPELFNKLYQYNVIIPFAMEIAEGIKTFPLSIRTNINKVFDFIKYSAVLHQYQREIKDGSIIAIKQDLKIAVEVLGTTTIKDYGVSISKRQVNVIEYIKRPVIESPEYLMKKDQLRLNPGEFDFEMIYSGFQGMPRSSLYRMLNKLTTLQILRAKRVNTAYSMITIWSFNPDCNSLYTTLKRMSDE